MFLLRGENDKHDQLGARLCLYAPVCTVSNGEVTVLYRHGTQYDPHHVHDYGGLTTTLPQDCSKSYTRNLGECSPTGIFGEQLLPRSAAPAAAADNISKSTGQERADGTNWVELLHCKRSRDPPLVGGHCICMLGSTCSNKNHE